ncbi:hypothetical protein GIB67_023006 [Kingdonia uniflora]|uniref:J domain-containing protein n=1 Tax=Kingdonia uniflora TaxID=39325 RepID=A0A7J7P2H1_9MAGN|nr:hypothetical protein GIB67_023006 [Kingdonia uniflora]
MDLQGTSDGASFYNVLGIRIDATSLDIRNAYRKLALKWHPDRWAKDPTIAEEAKNRFQKIQEAYSVLSDEGKRAMYDAFEEKEDEWSFKRLYSTFSQENSFEDLQKMFMEMAGDDVSIFGSNAGKSPSVSNSQCPSQREREMKYASN